MGDWLAFHATAGALSGLLLGAFVGRERWDTIAAPSPVRSAMSVRPWVTRDGRVGMAATLR